MTSSNLKGTYTWVMPPLHEACPQAQLISVEPFIPSQ